ncbi:TPA: hypothetical protein DEB00_00285 [Candidatus Uhrbacteria bacterium]|nr:hypothetical protein [Candidatus Uhrbacteria bacterium]
MENLLDIGVLVAVGGFALYGFAVGFVQTLTSLVGMIFSILVASRTYLPIADWILPPVLSDRFGVQLFVFFLILIFITSLVNIFVRVIDRVFHVVSIIPFTKSLNRALGFVLGLILGVLAIGALLFVSLQLPSLPSGLQEFLDQSRLIGPLIFLAGIVSLLFPSVIDQAKEFIPSS